MASNFGDLEASNFELFRDCLSTPLIEKSLGEPQKKTKKRKSDKPNIGAITSVNNSAERNDDAAELGEFVDYIALEIFTCLPEDLRTLEYYTWSKSLSLQETYALPLSTHDLPPILHNISPDIIESLTAYGLLSTTYTLDLFLLPILTAYITTQTKPPPAPSQTKILATACEICERDWVPLTYHHLIPRAVHAKVLKRGWHREDELQNVAWLCRACHSFVHRIATNEELAKEFYTVDLLLDREDVERFAVWVGRVRWKTR